MRLRFLLSLVLIAVLAACGDGTASRGGGAGPAANRIRLAYQAFPSGDLIVKNNKWLEEALPGYHDQWTKFDSGASINTAFIAGSSTSARSAPAPSPAVCRHR